MTAAMKCALLILIAWTSIAAADDGQLYLGAEAGAGIGTSPTAEVAGLFVHGAVSGEWRFSPALALGAQASAYTINVSWKDLLARATLAYPGDSTVRPYARVAYGLAFVPSDFSGQMLTGSALCLTGGLRITVAAGKDIDVAVTYGHWTATGPPAMFENNDQDLKVTSLDVGFEFAAL